MRRPALLRPSVLAATGLIAGFSTARATGRRGLGGAVFAAAGAGAAGQWWRTVGARGTLALSTLYVAAMGGSHPLAKRIGVWPAVLSVTAVVVATSETAARR